MKKGYTLIELLAVIVILAILALIAVPFISNVVSSSKKAASERSVEGYVKAINLAQEEYLTRSGGVKAASTNDLKVNYSGEVTLVGSIFDSYGMVSTLSANIGNYSCYYTKTKGATCSNELLDHVIVSNDPIRTNYLVGEAFDAEGMVVSATYKDGTSNEIIGYVVNPDDYLTISDRLVNISFSSGGVTRSTTLPIIVNDGLLLYDNGNQNVGWTDFVKSTNYANSILGDSYMELDQGECVDNSILVSGVRITNAINFNDYSTLHIITSDDSHGSFGIQLSGSTDYDNTVIVNKSTDGKQLEHNISLDKFNKSTNDYLKLFMLTDKTGSNTYPPYNHVKILKVWVTK